MRTFFTSYKGRQIDVGQRVEVYRNVNKPGVVYSIRDKESKLVLGHANTLILSNCNFIVKESGRKRVLREKRKNIHAWIEGYYGIVHAGDEDIFSNGIKVEYNPYKNITFVHHKYGYGQHMLMANLVWINESGVYAHGAYSHSVYRNGL
jgi:hypothetical protein